MVKEMRTRGVTRPPVRDGQREGFLCNLYAKLIFTLTRVRTHSDPERDDGGKDDSGQEVEGELVVTCGNAPEVLEATERCFDPPAITIAPFIVADEAFA